MFRLINLSQKLQKIKKMVKVKRFTATWCQPCKMLAPVVAQVQAENPDVAFETIDIDQNKNITSQYGVSSVPTIIIEKDGQEVKRIVGVLSKPALASTINSYK